MNQDGQNYWQETPQDQSSEPVRYEAYPVEPAAAHPSSEVEPISWNASEYIHHEKDGLWYSIFGGAVVVMIAISILLRSWTFAALIAVMAVTALVYAKRPPRELHYTLTAQGVEVDKNFSHYEEFRAFGVVQDGPFFAVQLIPLKRFALATTIYFPQEQGEAIVDRLGAALPMEKIEPDLVDKLVRRLRF